MTYFAKRKKPSTAQDPTDPHPIPVFVNDLRSRRTAAHARWVICTVARRMLRAADKPHALKTTPRTIGFLLASGVAGALYEPELFAMCDYSLHGVATRPARVGDKLVTTQFWNTTTRGFSAMEEPRVAVCLLPGTEIAFEDKVERHLTGFQLLFKKARPLPHQVARFQQVNMDNPCTHHDALEFPDGQVVMLTHLREGQRAVVLQLPAQAKKTEAEHPLLPEARCALERLHDPQAG